MGRTGKAKGLLTASALAAVILLTGCALHQAGPHAASVSGPIAAPTDLVVARKLLAQKRVEMPQLAIIVGMSVGPPKPLAGRAVAGKLGQAVWLPDVSLVGTSTQGGELSADSAELIYPSSVRLVITREPSSDAARRRIPPLGPMRPVGTALVPFTVGLQQPHWARISVGGNRGWASSRYTDLHGGGAVPAGVVWTEGGFRYNLSSWALDPDQLLAIAGTMTQVKP